MDGAEQFVDFDGLALAFYRDDIQKAEIKVLRARSKIDSLAMIEVPYCLFSVSSREARLIASPMAV